MNKIYDSLSPNSKATVNSILDKVMGSILDDNDKVNVNMLKAVLEQLNAEKQNLKAQIKADNDAIKAAEKEAAQTAPRRPSKTAAEFAWAQRRAQDNTA